MDFDCAWKKVGRLSLEAVLCWFGPFDSFGWTFLHAARKLLFILVTVRALCGFCREVYVDFSFLTFPISMFPRMAYTEFTTTGMLHCLQSCPDWYSRTIPRIIPMDDAMVLNKFEVWSHVFKHYPESCLQNIFLTPVFSETFCRYCAASAGNPLPQHGWLMNKNTRFDGFECSSFSSWDFTLLNSKTWQYAATGQCEVSSCLRASESESSS